MQTQPRTPDTTARAALLDAVEALCATRAPSDVTMRQIADEAGVSTGLAYHHFASKVDLLGAALARIGGDFAATTEAVEPQDVVPVLIDAMRARPSFVRIVAWFTLRGDDITALMGKHPLMASVAERAAQSGHDRPGDLAAMLAVIGLGTAFFGPSVARATGTDPTSDVVIEMLARAFDDAARTADGSTAASA